MPTNATWRLQNQTTHLVSLVDAVDELLGWRVPQEVHGGRIHRLYLHTLWGCSRHCSRVEVEGGATDGRGVPGGEDTKDKKETLVATQDSGAIRVKEGMEVGASQANLCSNKGDSVHLSFSVGELLP